MDRPTVTGAALRPSPAAGHDPAARPAPVTAPSRMVTRIPAGWLAVSAVTAAVAVSWLPVITGPLGNNHFGRVHGRYALQLRNFQEKGLLDSSFGADWSPYSSKPYAHHPPLAEILSWLFGALPGNGEWQVRLGPYLLALLALPAGAALLRGFGLRWPATLVAIGLMAVTGYYWIFGMVMFDIGTVLALSAAVVHLRRHPQPPRRLVVVGCVTAVLATLGSWPGIGFAAGLGIWLLMARRLDRVTLAVGASTVAGVAVSLSYMFWVHGWALAVRPRLHTSGGSFTAAEFVARQERFLTELLPAWYLVLLPIAVIAGLLDRRTRFYTAMATVFAVAWVVVLNNGAYIHWYWAFLVLVPGLVGMGILLDRLAGLVPGQVAMTGTLAAAAGLAGMFAVMVFGPVGQDYMYRPADAGRLVADHPPAAGQQYAWHVRLRVPRWLAYYWELKPREATPETLTEAGAADLVVVNLDKPPNWFDPSAVQPVAQEGRYALFRAADFRSED